MALTILGREDVENDERSSRPMTALIEGKNRRLSIQIFTKMINTNKDDESNLIQQ